MSYERRTSMHKLEQHRARQIARMEAFERAIEAGQTTVVVSGRSPDASTMFNSVTKTIPNHALFKGKDPLL
ncbi:hypothetical protein [Serratia fonticola]|jgi:hypothetical protein|uniref:hypothetical protein n=1 Tax=Serratia fonticola TaxID=47917 RepID=UPI00192C3C75|nr:hypothetical protein [Serratia fonticola]MBL5862317.1 hypothetical protein [Serratia fonticola]MDK2374279.1 hypothetical protein [Serratia fonticola]